MKVGMKMKYTLFSLLALFIGFQMAAWPLLAEGAPRTKAAAFKPKPKPKTNGNGNKSSGANTCNKPASACAPPQELNLKSCECYTPSDAEELAGKDPNNNQQQAPAASNAPAKSGPQGPIDQVCINSMNEQLTQCQEETESASNKCDSEQDSGVSSAANGLTQFAMGVGQQVTQNTPSINCTGLGKAIAAANGAVPIKWCVQRPKTAA
jgi:hypothetical protein